MEEKKAEAGDDENGGESSKEETFRPPIAPLRPHKSETRLKGEVKAEKTEKTEAVKKMGPEDESDESACLLNKVEDRQMLPSAMYQIQPLPYKEPDWACAPPEGMFKLSVMRGGVDMGEEGLEKSCAVFGRLPQCDVRLEHPSISRFHAILQYGTNQDRGTKDPAAKGWHLMDLGSTHGSWRNKEQIPSKQYVRLRVGQMCKFGGSSRLFFLSGPDDDQEEETKETAPELKQKAERRKLAMDKILNPDTNFDDSDSEGEDAEKTEAKESDGISWGMEYADELGGAEKEGEAQDEGEELDMDSLAKREEYYKSDPKKALKKFYERTGNDMEFMYEENGIGPKHSWTCRLELPLDTATGKAVMAEATTGGSKKDAAAQCALEACRILDAQALLHPSASIAGDNVRKRRNAELAQNDYYDSDEDTFLDRTGELERKRQRRKARIEGAKDSSNRPLTYTQLCAKQDELKAQGDALEKEIEALSKLEAQAAERAKNEEGDELDAYMREIKRDESGAIGETARELKVKKSQKRMDLVRLRTEFAQVERMAKIAKPVELPSAKPSTTAQSKIWVGSMKGFGKKKALVAPSAPTQLESQQETSNEPEVEEDEEEDVKVIPDVKEEKSTGPKPTSATKPKKPEVPPRSKSAPSEPDDTPGSTKAVTPESQEEPKPEASKATDGIAEGKGAERGEEGGAEEEKVKKKRHRVRGERKKKREDGDELAEYDATDPDYAVWLPPSDQSGDGRTALNDRLGY